MLEGMSTSGARVLKSVYKSLLKDCKSLERDGLSSISLVRDAFRYEFQSSRLMTDKFDMLIPEAKIYLKPAEATSCLSVSSSLSWNSEHENFTYLSLKDLRLLIGSYFRGELQIEENERNIDKVDQALSTMKCVNNQRLITPMVTVSSFNEKKNARQIRVWSVAKYDPHDTESESHIYSSDDINCHFYYKISIANTGYDPVVLVARHWLFKSGEQTIEVPKFAPGVIGKFPVIASGEVFEYNSKCVLNGEGEMQGTLLFHDDENSFFEVDVNTTPLRRI
jgi:uncharacterized protein affecting Mg2+/Co2+ transport